MCRWAWMAAWGKRWNPITFKEDMAGHLYSHKSDAPMQMLIFMFFICITEMFFMISIYVSLTLTNLSAAKASSLHRSEWEMYHYYSSAATAGKHKTAMQLLTNSSCNLSVQTLDFIILLISSSFPWIICQLLSSSRVLSSWCGKTHQESISRPCPCVSQSKSGASSSSPSLQAELFTSHWCGGWPAVLLVNNSCTLYSSSKGLTLRIYFTFYLLCIYIWVPWKAS